MSVCAVCGERRSNLESDPHGMFGHHEFQAKAEEPVADVRDPAATLVLCAWLERKIKSWKAEAKERLGLLTGERKAAVIGNQVIGHVTMAQGKRTAKVANEAALLAFVKARHPTEIEVVEQVRPVFLKHLLDTAVKRGAFLDSDGVVIDGLIDVVDGAPYPMSKLAEDADIAISGLLAKGALGVNGLKAIEAQ